MNSGERVGVVRMGFCGNNNAALRNLDNIVAERFRHRVQRQRAVDEPLNKFETAHCLSLVVIYDAETFPSRRRCHELSQASRIRGAPRRSRSDLSLSSKEFEQATQFLAAPKHEQGRSQDLR